MAGLLDFLMGGQQPQTQQAPPQDMVQGILSGRFQPDQSSFQPNIGDYSSGIMSSINGKPMGGADVASGRAAEVMKTLATIGAMQRTNLMMQGGPTGALINRFQAGNPNASIGDAISAVKAPVQNMSYNNGQVAPLPGAPQAAGQMAYGKQSGEKQADIQAAPAIAYGTETGKQAGENLQLGRSNQDIVSMYGKIINDAQTTPSGALESGVAKVSNLANTPTAGAKSQAAFDADLNNLYLATIRSLKGTGRVMEQELNRIAESAPKDTDSNEVKIIKAQKHMEYYTDRMKSLGFDPSTGAPLSNQLGPTGGPVNLSGASDQVQPPGQLIGTSGGKNVYQLPDGSHVMEQ